MSEGSSNPASPSRPVMVSEQQETLTPVSHIFGLSEVSTSLEALNIEVERKPTVVHHAQASYSPGASMTPLSPNARDHWRSTQASPLNLKRYALQTALFRIACCLPFNGGFSPCFFVIQSVRWFGEQL